MPVTSFSPRLLQDDDAGFLGWFGAWAVIGLTLAATASQVPATAPSLDQAELRHHVVRTMVLPPAPERARPTTPAPEPAAVAMRSAPERTAATPGPARSRREAVAAASVLLQVLGTEAPSRAGVVALWADPASHLDLDEALQQASHTQTTGPLLRTRDSGGAADIELSELGGGTTRLSSSPVTVAAGPIRSPDRPDDLRPSIQENVGQLRYCYERASKVGQADGRIEVDVTLASGRVVGAPRIRFDDTGSPELASCVARKIRSWEFPVDANGEVTWPMVFRPIAADER